MERELHNDTGTLLIRTIASGYELRGFAPGRRAPHSPISTGYPIELISKIFDTYGAAHTCDEISRDSDETEAVLDVRFSVEAYLTGEILTRSLRILDYGCGSGSSTMTLAHLFPRAEIIGVDLSLEHLAIARMRAKHHSIRATFSLVTPDGGVDLPGRFDLVFLNAVYEHLLPTERPQVIRNIWRMLRPEGYLILNQTPHRWFPIETHTTGLPLLNYFPDRAVRALVNHWSDRKMKRETWDQLLRAGIRGATANEVMVNVRQADSAAKLLRPIRVARSQAGIWYAAKRQRIGKVRNWTLRAAISVAGAIGLPAPYITIAVRKSGTDRQRDQSSRGDSLQGLGTKVSRADPDAKTF